jgi:hypothetical protein
MSVVKAFNNVLIDFMDDCILVFPEEKEFKKYKRGAQVLKDYNPKKIPIIFKEYSKIYRAKIDVRDETFFLENNYNDIDEVQEDNDLIELIDKIKKYWTKLTTENKDKIWKYIEVLVKLSDKI